MRYTSLFLIFFLTACSTPSKYQKLSKKEGYSDKVIEQNLRMSFFQANSSTKKDKAELYAKFHAIEVCHELNKPLTHIMLVKDQSRDEQITQATSYYPNYSYGMAPYYGRYGYHGAGVGMYAGVGVNNTIYTNETYTYPKFEVYFECVDRAFDARMSYKVISTNDMKEFVKDLKGAVQVDEILPDSPNKNIFQIGDIIISANGTRVGNILDLYKASRSSNQKNLNIEFFRNGVRMKAIAKFLDVSEMVKQAQEEIIKEACTITGLKDVRPLCK